jgi:hypothetical protein
MRGNAAALIQRHVHAAYDGKDLLLLQCFAQPEALRIFGIERDLGQELALDLTDVVQGRLLLVDGDTVRAGLS